ncbi:succinylglutamate desuccinylase [Echinimonas agarilytica]|uniref:Succinylglutamate desuccinylase n=1 Tax=Echinimonas agarilytica TaxID=1215918 RepID=A0AA42B8Z9_9GAMM|nr:succinylglutamate desuccinylase [Echinimonas agarilytica]MCM2680786.1 succinylglutamate desuccinylase [Echinimonas agarilytica]
MKAFNLLEATQANEHTDGESWQDAANLWQWHGQGILQVEPRHRDIKRSIVLSCGVHGNETAPIELLNSLVAELSLEQQSLTARVLFIVGNPPAIELQKRFIDENLNRLFVRKEPPFANAEQRRAKTLEMHVDRFFAASDKSMPRVHYDLHTAIRGSEYPFFAVYPFVQNMDFSSAAVARIQASGIDTVLLSSEPSTTFSHYSAKYHGAEAFTVELGQVSAFGHNNLEPMVPIRRVIKSMLHDNFFPEPELNDAALNLFQVSRVIHRNYDDFSLAFDDQLKNFTRFKKDQPLAYEANQTIYADFDNEVVVFPNAAVAIGQRAMLTLKAADASVLRS